MTIVWKRIKDKTNEHHAFKCLVLLEFLLQHGNHEMVLSQVQNNLHHIQGVTSFSLKNANGAPQLLSSNPNPNLTPA